MNREEHEPAPPEWWREFFEQPFGDLQLAGLHEDRAAEDADFLERALELEPGAALLDAPCGAGRHAIELAARGYAVAGVDFNERVLARARSRAGERGVACEWSRADLRELDFEERFDAAYCYWGSFGYFDEAGERAFAEGVCRALGPGGRFLIDTPALETLLPRFAASDWSWWGPTRVLHQRHWDPSTGRIEESWTFIRDGREATHRASVRIYAVHELGALLRSAGFARTRALETLTGKPFFLGASRLSLIAEK